MRPVPTPFSPMLSNIYLNELDEHFEKLVSEFNKGKIRPRNLEYRKLENRKVSLRKAIRGKGKPNPKFIKELQEIDKKQKQTPSGNPRNDNYKRLRYCRYADDFVAGIIGSKEDAELTQKGVENFLKEKLDLEISEAKTCIKHGQEGVEFLSYQVNTKIGNRIKKVKRGKQYMTMRTVTESIRLGVPIHKVKNFCKKYHYGDWQSNKPHHRAELLNSSEVEIIETYNAELRGLSNYYSIADDVKGKLNRLQYLLQYSLFKTLAGKSKSKITRIIGKLKQGNEYIHRHKVNGEWKSLKVFQLKHMEKAPKNWNNDVIPNTLYLTANQSELVRRIEAGICEYCGRGDRPVDVHHVRKLKDLKKKSNLQLWAKVMIARNRKTIILCKGSKDSCHYLLHAGKLPDNRFNHEWGATKV